MTGERSGEKIAVSALEAIGDRVTFVTEAVGIVAGNTKISGRIQIVGEGTGVAIGAIVTIRASRYHIPATRACIGCAKIESS